MGIPDLLPEALSEPSNSSASKNSLVKNSGSMTLELFAGKGEQQVISPL